MNRQFRIQLIMAVTVALMACTSWATEPYYAKVVGITDGDTITVLHEKTQVKIRLYGIDTPERGQAFGKKSQQFTSEQVFGKIVIVTPMDVDRYGRTVAIVKTQDVTGVLNEALVETGLAWVYRKYCKADFCTDWLTIEDVAKAAGYGLWADPNPIPPWEFRRR